MAGLNNTLDLAIEVSPPATGMAQAIVTELLEHLDVYVANGLPQVIDLTGIPMNDTDKRELETLLGRGEVEIKLSALGESQVFETAVSGIWWIRHYSADEKLIAELIEVTEVPEIIKTHPDDIRHAASQLRNKLDKG